ncbi:Glycopeptide antibiotics resistance protein [Clostridium cavendishii DSM 21758]|uniref:Glycopeptide antibiotics resistance protein n=1 Tax=Clostridium cavendishii DSM 21758 TaxID=1121302 RepID=A0A1M6BG43_9CLOT|nr:VanZ family protein [Clostridium cavendishii]SHI47691.1 Glycopeptide antibiotics resistance protein [Clostridium cavendishii DSM 21758]
MNYLYPIKMAIYTFPIVAFLISLPFLIYQYRRYGYFNKFRAFIIYSFILFLMCAYFLIILPLPKTRDVLSMQRPGTQYTQFKPFNFISDIARETKVNFDNPKTYLRMLKERAFYQALFNFFLLMPLGVYLRYHFKRNFKQTTIIVFFTSLFFEVTQITALYGYYNAPYRVFDVDDLILNTAGGILGYFIAQNITRKLPHSEDIDKKFNAEIATVSVIRRVIAFFIDSFIIELMIIIPSILLRSKFSGIKINIANTFITIIFWYIYFVMISKKKDGSTIGKRFVKIKLKREDNILTKKMLIIRYFILYMLVYGIKGGIDLISELAYSYGYINIDFILDLIGIVYIIGLTIYFVSVTLGKEKLFIHEKISRIKNVVSL